MPHAGMVGYPTSSKIHAGTLIHSSCMWGVPLGQSQQAACSTRVVWLPRPPQSPRTPQQRQLVTMASQSPRRRPSVLTQLLSIPRRVDAYFAGRVVRQIIWSFISFSTGFYSANVVSLSFGAIAVNDVIAAVFTVAFVEIVSKIYYEADKVDLKLQFANFFKMGVCAALIADALKLGG